MDRLFSSLYLHRCNHENAQSKTKHPGSIRRRSSVDTLASAKNSNGSESFRRLSMTSLSSSSSCPTKDETLGFTSNRLPSSNEISTSSQNTKGTKKHFTRSNNRRSSMDASSLTSHPSEKDSKGHGCHRHCPLDTTSSPAKVVLDLPVSAERRSSIDSLSFLHVSETSFHHGGNGSAGTHPRRLSIDNSSVGSGARFSRRSSLGSISSFSPHMQHQATAAKPTGSGSYSHRWSIGGAGKPLYRRQEQHTETTEECTETSHIIEGISGPTIREVKVKEKKPKNTDLEMLRYRTAKPPALTRVSPTPIDSCSSFSSSSDELSTGEDSSELMDPATIKYFQYQYQSKRDKAASKIQAMVRSKLAREKWRLSLLSYKLRLIEERKQDELSRIKAWKAKEMQKIEQQALQSYDQSAVTVTRRENLARATIEALKAANKKIRKESETIYEAMEKYEREKYALEESINEFQGSMKKANDQVATLEHAHEKLSCLERRFRQRRDQYVASYAEGADLLEHEHKLRLHYWKSLCDIFNAVQERHQQLEPKCGFINLEERHDLTWVEEHVCRTTLSLLHKDPILDKNDTRYILDCQKPETGRFQRRASCPSSSTTALLQKNENETTPTKSQRLLVVKSPRPTPPFPRRASCPSSTVYCDSKNDVQSSPALPPSDNDHVAFAFQSRMPGEFKSYPRPCLRRSSFPPPMIIDDYDEKVVVYTPIEAAVLIQSKVRQYFVQKKFRAIAQHVRAGGIWDTSLTEWALVSYRAVMVFKQPSL